MDRRKALSLLAALPFVGRFFKARKPEKPRVVGTLWFKDGRKVDFVDHGGPKAPALSASGLVERSAPQPIECTNVDSPYRAVMEGPCPECGKPLGGMVIIGDEFVEQEGVGYHPHCYWQERCRLIVLRCPEDRLWPNCQEDDPGPAARAKFRWDALTFFKPESKWDGQA